MSAYLPRVLSLWLMALISYFCCTLFSLPSLPANLIFTLDFSSTCAKAKIVEGTLSYILEIYKDSGKMK